MEERSYAPAGLPAGCGQLLVLCPAAPASYTVYLQAGSLDEGRAVWEALRGPKPNLAVLAVEDWNARLSPWPAADVMPGKAFSGGDFAGEGAAQLRLLTQNILPAVEALPGCQTAHRALVGYSLAGLFALWALYNTDAFAMAASVSGSLWYEGLARYMADTPLQGTPARAYFSLGEKEAAAKNPRLATVATGTANAVQALRAAGVPCLFALNPGGHFVNPALRLAKGIDALLGPGGGFCV